MWDPLRLKTILTPYISFKKNQKGNDLAHWTWKISGVWFNTGRILLRELITDPGFEKTS